MGVPKDDLTPEQKFTADRLAILQYRDIKYNAKAMDFLVKKVADIPNHRIPCDYRMTNKEMGFLPNERMTALVGRILEDIEDGKIILTQEPIKRAIFEDTKGHFFFTGFDEWQVERIKVIIEEDEQENSEEKPTE